MVDVIVVVDCTKNHEWRAIVYLNYFFIAECTYFWIDTMAQLRVASTPKKKSIRRKYMGNNWGIKCFFFFEKCIDTKHIET